MPTTTSISRTYYFPVTLTKIETSQQGVKLSETKVVGSDNPTRNTAITKTWVRTAGYKKRRAAGSLPTNPYSYQLTRDRGYFGSFYEKRLVSGIWVERWWDGAGPRGNFGVSGTPASGFGAPDPKMIAAVESKVRSQFLERVKDQKINVAQMFGESKQTINLIADAAMKIAECLRKLRRGDIIGAGKALAYRPSRKTRRNYREQSKQSPADAASDAWLAMQYGWKPLLMDVKGAAEQLSEGIRAMSRVQVSARASESQSVTVNVTSASTSGHVYTQDFNRIYSIKYSCTYEVSMALTALSTRLGLQNPLQLGWELLPYSFVIDWFIPIGQFLSSLDATAGLTIVSGSRTTVDSGEIVETVSPHPDRSNTAGPYYWQLTGALSGFKEHRYVTRTILSEWPRPIFPSVKDPVSLTHAANAIALLQKVFSGR